MASKPHLVTITGATGHIGSVLTRRLLEGGIRVRVIGRDAAKLSALTALGAEPRSGDVQDGPFMSEAFRGADAVFAMIPPFYAASDVAAAFRAVAASLAGALASAKVPRVVALNGITPDVKTDPIAALHEFDRLLRRLPDVSVLSLRPAFFMENLLPAMHGIKRTGIMSSAHRADLATPMVATRDIAAAAAEALRRADFTGYVSRELLGAKDYTFREATAVLGASVGKPELPYVQCSYQEFRGNFVRAGMSDSAADFHVELARVFNEVPTGVARSAANSTATNLEAFAREVFAPAFLAR